MKLEPFKLERFFAKYEFNVEHQMSASDCESISIGELLQLPEAQDAHDSNGREQLTESSRQAPGTGHDLRKEFEKLTLGYTESTGDPRLRQAVSTLYEHISPEGTLIAAPEELIFLLLNSHLEKNDHVIVTTPAYQSLTELPRSLGCKVSYWPVELKQGRWRLDLGFLAQELTPHTKMVIVNIPHNPTGLVFTQAEKKELTELLRKNGSLLLADEMYWQLEYDENANTMPFCDLYERAISLSGLSKSYGLPGLRIGWLASQTPALLDQAAGLKDYTTICNSAPSEFLAYIAVHHSSRLVERCKNIIMTNIKLLEQLSLRFPDKIEFLPGGGGSILFPRFKDGRSAEAFSKRLIEEQNLLMLPGPLFDMPDHFFRVGLGRESLPVALSRFEELL